MNNNEFSQIGINVLRTGTTAALPLANCYVSYKQAQNSRDPQIVKGLKVGATWLKEIPQIVPFFDAAGRLVGYVVEQIGIVLSNIADDFIAWLKSLFAPVQQEVNLGTPIGVEWQIQQRTPVVVIRQRQNYF